MMLRETALARGVKCKDTCKLFFGFYPYSLTTPVPKKLIKNKDAAIAHYNKIAEQRRNKLKPYHKAGKTPPRLPAIEPSIRKINLTYKRGVEEIITDLVETYEDILAPDEYYVAFNRANITFYVRNEETAVALLKRSNVFVSVTEPHSPEVEQFLTKHADKRVVVRESLFSDEFDYRVEFKWKPDQDYAELDARVERMIFQKKSYSYGTYRKLYLYGDDDLILARLGLGEWIDNITKCVLRSKVPPC